MTNKVVSDSATTFWYILTFQVSYFSPKVKLNLINITEKHRNIFSLVLLHHVTCSFRFYSCLVTKDNVPILFSIVVQETEIMQVAFCWFLYCKCYKNVMIEAKLWSCIFGKGNFVEKVIRRKRKLKRYSNA